MQAKIPKDKWQRTWIGAKTAARLTGNCIGYLATKPFMRSSAEKHARLRLDSQNAAIVFSALSLLRGTSLKIAQQLSLEMDLFPEAVTKELEKSYHQVPPINRALARKAIIDGLGAAPELIFNKFETKAFAAASLGQVHLAENENIPLAVKLQYPGIATTIKNDIYMIRNLLRPFADYQLIKPALDEIEARLLEEIDYHKEAAHVQLFRKELNLSEVAIPTVHQHLSCSTVISLDFLRGQPLDIWLQQGPSQQERDHVADILNTIFLKSLYELGAIHADPNPGNFIINRNLTVGLVDFGCIKRFTPEFVSCYRSFPKIIVNQDRNAYFSVLSEFNILPENVPDSDKEQLWTAASRLFEWFSRLFESEYFDFATHQNFINQGKPLLNDIYHLRRSLKMNPDFVFLDRTRYGLLRLFEKMKARVKLRNAYEWS
jgi:predicted unusual protein kinase regulating ubiquinone biosynthesis (AarF/ABC1/UbiB family)